MKFKKIGIVKIEKTTKMKYDTNDSNKMFLINYYYYFFFKFLLPVLGPLTRYMTPTLDAALLMCGSPERGRATSSRAGADLG